MDLRIGRLAVALLCASLALLAATGLSLALAPDATVSGTVGARGWTGDGRCYPTVEYTVEGETYRTTPRKDERWCDYEWGSRATVFLDPDSPEDGRLSKYGDAPARLAVAALATFFAGLLVAVRRRQRARWLGSIG